MTCRKVLLSAISLACLFGVAVILAQEEVGIAANSDGNSIYGAFKKVRNPKLVFKKRGTDLSVSLTVSANNSAYISGTYHCREGDKTLLLYLVIQNKDNVVRSQKRITVNWVVPGGESKADAYEVFGCDVYPTGKKLQSLLPDRQVDNLMKKPDEILKKPDRP